MHISCCSDIKGFSGLHKLINGIPYDAPDHQGWTAVRRYIKYKEDAGTIAQELEEYQNKTTPMLMAACECLDVLVVEVGRICKIFICSITRTLFHRGPFLTYIPTSSPTTKLVN